MSFTWDHIGQQGASDATSFQYTSPILHTQPRILLRALHSRNKISYLRN